VFGKNLVVLVFVYLFMPPLPRADIRDADESSLPLGDHTEFGDLKFPAPECLLILQVCLALDWSATDPCCNELLCRSQKV
jgi:hypothetical protein